MPTALRLCLMVLLILAAGLVACTTNPATGQRQLNVMTEAQEISVGQQAAPQFLDQYGGPIPDEQIRAYVADIGRRLAATSERPELPWEFHVVDSAVINAFALPGGKVFMSRGLMERMENEAQLAGVLGHEIGHVTAQHIGQQMSRQMVLSGLLVGLGVAAQVSDRDWLQVLGAVGGVGGGVYLMSFGREQESEADSLGLRYMTRLGYNPVGQVQVMEILREASGPTGAPEFLSTHPLPDTRIRRLEDEIRKNYPEALDTGTYAFHEDRFRERFLDRVRNLPPARHTGQERRGDGAEHPPHHHAHHAHHPGGGCCAPPLAHAHR
jgi:predicted Zn-dependent protease